MATFTLPEKGIDAFIASRKPAKKGDRDVYRDPKTEGLELRITSTGNRSWSYRFRAGGEQERTTFHVATIAEARDAATRFRKDILDGKNPQQARRAEKAAPTFGEVVAEYLKWAPSIKNRRRLRASSLRTRTSELQRPLAAWRDRTMVSLTRKDVVTLLESIADDTVTGVRSNRVHSALSAVFKRALKLEIVDRNLLRDIEMCVQEEPKDRNLDDAELCVFWKDTAGDSDPCLAARLLLLTAQRVSQCTGLQDVELVDLHNEERAHLAFPAERMKGKKPHVVPLTGPALAIARKLAARRRNASNVFVTRRGTPLKAEQLREFMGKMTKCAKWAAPATPHDLRRTAATQLSKLGIVREDRMAVLAHVHGDVHEDYDQYKRFAEKRVALGRWGQRLLEIVGEAEAVDNVLQFAASGR